MIELDEKLFQSRLAELDASSLNVVNIGDVLRIARAAEGVSAAMRACAIAETGCEPRWEGHDRLSRIRDCMKSQLSESAYKLVEDTFMATGPYISEMSLGGRRSAAEQIGTYLNVEKMRRVFDQTALCLRSNKPWAELVTPSRKQADALVEQGRAQWRHQRETAQTSLPITGQDVNHDSKEAAMDDNNGKSKHGYVYLKFPTKLTHEFNDVNKSTGEMYEKLKCHIMGDVEVNARDTDGAELGRVNLNGFNVDVFRPKWYADDVEAGKKAVNVSVRADRDLQCWKKEGDGPTTRFTVNAADLAEGMKREREAFASKKSTRTFDGPVSYVNVFKGMVHTSRNNPDRVNVGVTSGTTIDGVDLTGFRFSTFADRLVTSQMEDEGRKTVGIKFPQEETITLWRYDDADEKQTFDVTPNELDAAMGKAVEAFKRQNNLGEGYISAGAGTAPVKGGDAAPFGPTKDIFDEDIPF